MKIKFNFEAWNPCRANNVGRIVNKKNENKKNENKFFRHMLVGWLVFLCILALGSYKYEKS